MLDSYQKSRTQVLLVRLEKVHFISLIFNKMTRWNTVISLLRYKRFFMWDQYSAHVFKRFVKHDDTDHNFEINSILMIWT